MDIIGVNVVEGTGVFVVVSSAIRVEGLFICDAGISVAAEVGAFVGDDGEGALVDARVAVKVGPGEVVDVMAGIAEVVGEGLADGRVCLPGELQAKIDSASTIAAKSKPGNVNLTDSCSVIPSPRISLYSSRISHAVSSLYKSVPQVPI